MSELTINGYVLEKELTNNNAGFSRWGFGEKDGRQYFIKEFLSPVYPEDESVFSPKQFEAKKKGCQMFEEEKTKLYRMINEATDGNIMCIEEMFRYGSKYYISMKRVRSLDVAYDKMSFVPYPDRLRLACILAHSLMSLHAKGIVHGDLKWSNIIFCQSSGGIGMSVKIIDYDNSFLIDNPPKNHGDFNVDQIYCAPETFLYLEEEDVKLGTPIDVFAFAVIIYQILTGQLPVLPADYDYLYETALDEQPVGFVTYLEPRLTDLIRRMLSLDPNMRPDMVEVYNTLAAVAGCVPVDNVTIPLSIHNIGIGNNTFVENANTEAGIENNGLDSGVDRVVSAGRTETTISSTHVGTSAPRTVGGGIKISGNLLNPTPKSGPVEMDTLATDSEDDSVPREIASGYFTSPGDL